MQSRQRALRYKYYILKYVQNVSTSKENTAGTKSQCWYKVTKSHCCYKVTLLLQSHTAGTKSHCWYKVTLLLQSHTAATKSHCCYKVTLLLQTHTAANRIYVKGVKVTLPTYRLL